MALPTLDIVMKMSGNVTGCFQKSSFDFHSKLLNWLKNIDIFVKKLINDMSNAQIKFFCEKIEVCERADMPDYCA